MSAHLDATEREPEVVGHVFSPRKGPGAYLWSVGTGFEGSMHGDVEIQLMSDGTVRWVKPRFSR